MTNLVVQVVTVVAWFVYIFPPLACSKGNASRIVRGVLSVLIGAGLGWGFGQVLVDFLVQ